MLPAASIDKIASIGRPRDDDLRAACGRREHRRIDAVVGAHFVSPGLQRGDAIAAFAERLRQAPGGEARSQRVDARRLSLKAGRSRGDDRSGCGCVLRLAVMRVDGRRDDGQVVYGPAASVDGAHRDAPVTRHLQDHSSVRSAFGEVDRGGGCVRAVARFDEVVSWLEHGWHASEAGGIGGEGLRRACARLVGRKPDQHVDLGQRGPSAVHDVDFHVEARGDLPD